MNSNVKRPAAGTLVEPIRYGCEALGLAIGGERIDKLAAFVTLLARWNRVYNLTAVRQPGDMVGRHLLDSLAVMAWVSGPDLLDVGSGAGVPGLPLAIARPELAVTCLDASAKKARFMRQAISELGLQNVQVEHRRVEQFQPETPYRQVISRAFSSLQAMQQKTARLCAVDGQLLAMKGTRPGEELLALQTMGYEPQVIELQVPGLDAKRHLIAWSPGGVTVTA